MARKELWDAMRVNEARFKAVLEEGEGNEWRVEGSGGFRWRVPVLGVE